MKRLKAFPQDNKNGCLLLTNLFDTVLEVLVKVIRQENEIQGTWIRKEEVQFSLFKDDIILYEENLRYLLKYYLNK